MVLSASSTLERIDLASPVIRVEHNGSIESAQHSNAAVVDQDLVGVDVADDNVVGMAHSHGSQQVMKPACKDRGGNESRPSLPIGRGAAFLDGPRNNLLKDERSRLK